MTTTRVTTSGRFSDVWDGLFGILENCRLLYFCVTSSAKAIFLSEVVVMLSVVVFILNAFNELTCRRTLRTFGKVE